MIHISRVRIELPKEAVIHCDITTDESIEQYKSRINTDLLKYNIKATIDITSGALKPEWFTEAILRAHVGKKVRTKFGDGKIVETKVGEKWPVDDSVRIETENGRFMTVPASQVLEIVEG